MGYTWLGMRKLTWEEVLQRHENGELAGCFRLYDDNSEAMIDRGYDFAGDILAHHKKGGEFGIRTLDDEPDWATVKAVQESILTAFTDAGVNFKFGYEERVAQAIKQARKDGEKV